MKTVDIKGRPYVEVNERIKYFREHCIDWSLTSEIVSLENGICVIKATICDEKGTVRATGLAYEKEGSTFINKTSYIENCETSAWGRALGNLGIGIDTSIASAEEVGNAILNQQQPEKRKVVKDFPGLEGLEVKDSQIYINLMKIETIDEIKSYYEINKENVVDQKAFHTACNTKIKQIKEQAKLKPDEVAF